MILWRRSFLYDTLDPEKDFAPLTVKQQYSSVAKNIILKFGSALTSHTDRRCIIYKNEDTLSRSSRALQDALPLVNNFNFKFETYLFEPIT